MRRSRITIAIPISSSNRLRANRIFHTSECNRLKRVVELDKTSRTHTVKSLTI